MGSPHISSDVLTKIAEYLVGHRNDLYTFLLICKDSQYIAEALLYRKLEFTWNEGTLAIFINSLERNPRLADFVKSITCRFFRAWIDRIKCKPAVSEPDFIRRVLLACPNLERLTMFVNTAEWVGALPAHANLQHFILVEEGNLGNPSYRLIPTLLPKLEGFPRLEFFRFQGGVWTIQHETITSKPLVTNLIHSRACSSLHTFIIEGICFNSFDLRFLRDLLPNIKVLAVELVKQDAEQEAPALDECFGRWALMRELSLLTFVNVKQLRFKLNTSLLVNLTRFRTNSFLVPAENLRELACLTVLSYSLVNSDVSSEKTFLDLLFDRTYLPSLQKLFIRVSETRRDHHTYVLKEIEERRGIKAAADFTHPLAPDVPPKSESSESTFLDSVWC